MLLNTRWMRNAYALCSALSLHLLFALGFGLPVFAQQQVNEAPDSMLDRLDSIWEGARLYRNPHATGIQSLSLVGRYHGQYWDVDSLQGEADGWDDRRIIFGVQSQLFDQYKVDLQMHVNDDFSPIYRGLYTASLKWTSSEQLFSVNGGRLDYVYTGLERSTSSKKIVTFERGLLAGQLMPGEVVGLYSDASLSQLSIQGGLYSGEIGDEFSDFSAGLAAGLSLVKEVPLIYETGSLHLDFLYNDGDPGNNAFAAYQGVMSVWHKGRLGAFELGVDLTLGQGSFEGRSDVAGLTLIPTIDLLHDSLIAGDKLQFAMRYQLARSQGENGLDIPRRYEREVSTGAGDHYQAFYMGLNYLLYGDRLKLMAGAEYAQMKDQSNDGGEYQGWDYLAGLRFYF